MHNEIKPELPLSVNNPTCSAVIKSDVITSKDQSKYKNCIRNGALYGVNGSVSHIENGVHHCTKPSLYLTEPYEYNGLRNGEACKLENYISNKVKTKVTHILQTKATKLKPCKNFNEEKFVDVFGKITSSHGSNNSDECSEKVCLPCCSDDSTSISTCNVFVNKCNCNSNTISSKTISIDDNFVHNRKHVKLKQYVKDENSTDVTPGFYIFQSVRRLGIIKLWLDRNWGNTNKVITDQLLKNINDSIEIHLQTGVCHPKQMRSSPKGRINSSVSYEESLNGTDCYFKCEWFDCTKKFSTVENVTKHVKKDHVNLASKSDVFVCLWRNCRFSNQPSCSYKWLLKHVLRHCDIKPFKCVIFGCEMAFVSQNGLARHVPTHFNEGKVRRTCVMTNTNEASQHWESPKVKKNLAIKLNNLADFVEVKEDNIVEVDTPTRLEKFVGKHKKKGLAKRCWNQKLHTQVKGKLDKTSCSSLKNHGFIGKSFRIEHQVVGRRTLQNGDSDMLLSPSLDKIFQCKSFWIDTETFRKRKSTFVDVPVSKLDCDTKSILYDVEHASKRRKRKRKTIVNG